MALHLSVVWADEAAVADLEWQNINDTDRITLCNPLDFLDISSSWKNGSLSAGDDEPVSAITPAQTGVK